MCSVFTKFLKKNYFRVYKKLDHSMLLSLIYKCIMQQLNQFLNYFNIIWCYSNLTFSWMEGWINVRASKKNFRQQTHFAQKICPICFLNNYVIHLSEFESKCHFCSKRKIIWHNFPLLLFSTLIWSLANICNFTVFGGGL